MAEHQNKLESVRFCALILLGVLSIAFLSSCPTEGDNGQTQGDGKFSINISSAAAGALSVNKQRASANETVTITWATEKYYVKDSLRVEKTIGNPTEVPVSSGAGSWNFTMPASDVTITANYIDAAKALAVGGDTTFIENEASPSGWDEIHTFYYEDAVTYGGSSDAGSASYSFSNSVDINDVSLLIVAGGGGGGSTSSDNNWSGGGGAGGVIYYGAKEGQTLNNFESKVQPTYTILAANSPYTVKVGAGGVSASTGNDSVFGAYIAKGGGKGGSGNSVNAGDGGSGGGAFGPGSKGNALNSGAQGNNGAADANGSTSSGGGGAGGTGSNGTNTPRMGGNGGAGIALDISGTLQGYAGGGASGFPDNNTGLAGTGSQGGGSSNQNGAPGTGGGGGGRGGPWGAGGAGGSGIVIVRFPWKVN